MKTIKTSAANRYIVSELTNKLSMGPENVIARIALTYSLAQGRRLDTLKMADSKGKEYSSSVLFGDNQEIYLALLCQLYNIPSSHFDIPKYIKMHVDDGLELIQGVLLDNPNLTIFDFIVDQVESGLQVLKRIST